MTHVAPIPDKPPFMYGLTAFQTALSDILLCVIVERARVVTTLRTEILRNKNFVAERRRSLLFIL